ncbi:hypothetical protein [Portibacter marinus]|uniref:hypothetical protein n=1 Tax=Portibacter marinus TaxID=2898660 RepID=UPI001F2D00AE|nr:hypothetical protein [Portibacter marinus]
MNKGWVQRVRDLLKGRMRLNFVLIPVITLFLVVNSQNSNAQNYPVDVNLQILPPHSPAFHTFSQSQGLQANKILLSASLKDLAVSRLEIGLRIEFRGPNGVFFSDPALINLPISIQQGIPTVLSNNDLIPYLSSSGLANQITDIDGFMAEGDWEICVTAYELLNQEQVSSTSCFYLFLEQFDPPEIILPLDSLHPSFPQNVQLAWQPLHMGAFPVQYTIELWEVLDGFTEQQLVDLTAPYYVNTVNQITSDFITALDLPLGIGMEYIMRVRVEDKVNGGLGLPVYAFKNLGYSDLHRFKYGMILPGQICESPEAPNYLVDDQKDMIIYWGTGPPVQEQVATESPNSTTTRSPEDANNLSGNTRSISNELGQTGFSNYYNLHYRDITDGNAQEWRIIETAEEWMIFEDYLRGHKYEIYVTRICAAQERKSESLILKIPVLPPERDFSCGMPALEVDLSNEAPLQSLVTGDTIIAGDMRVVILDAQGANGYYSGSGYMKPPVFGAKVGLTFNQIFINEEYRLVHGEMRTMYDPTGGNMVDVGSWRDLFPANNDPFPVIELPQVSEVTFLDGKVIIYPEGGEYEAPLRVSTPDGDVLLTGGMIIREVEIDLPGNISGEFEVTFSVADNHRYGFDKVDSKLLSDYEQWAGTPLDHKSVARGGSDFIRFTLSKVPNYWTDTSMDSIQVITENKFELPYTAIDDQSIEIKVPGLEGPEVVFVLKGNQCLGAFHLVPYVKTIYTVNLIPVNGFGEDIDVISLEKMTNQILNQGVIETQLKLRIDQGISDYSGILAAETEVLSAYSDQMKTILRRHLETFGQDENQMYLFIVDQIEDPVNGAMPEGLNAGFIEMTTNEKELARTIAHELGHGAFTLNHFWIKTDYDQGQSDNLMDYSSGEELVYHQWNRMHNQRFPLPWFKNSEDQQSVGEGKIACVPDTSILELGLSNVFIDPDFKGITIPENALPLSFYRLDDKKLKGVLHSFLYLDEEYKVGFKKEENKNVFLGYYKSKQDENGAINTIAYDYIQLEEGGNKIIPSVIHEEIQVIYADDRPSEIIGTHVNYCDVEKAEEESVVELDIDFCEVAVPSATINSNLVDRVARKLDEMIAARNSQASKIRPKDQYWHLASVDFEKAPLAKKEADLLDEKLYLLKHHTGDHIYLIYARTTDRYTISQSREIAQLAYERSQNKDDQTFLIVLPYNSLLNNFSSACGFPGYYPSTPHPIENTAQVQSVSDYVIRIFQTFSKPLHLQAYLYLSDGSILELGGRTESNIIGQPAINAVRLYKSRHRIALMNELGRKPLLTQTSAEAIQEYIAGRRAWEDNVNRLRQTVFVEELKALNGEGIENILVLDENVSMLRESYSADKKVSLAYAKFHYEYTENYVDATLNEAFGDYEIDDKEHLHNEITPHDIAYKVIDLMALTLAPVGADFIADITGMLYTSIFNTHAFGKYAEYGSGLAIVFALDKVVKGGVKGYKAVRKLEDGKVVYQIFEPEYVLKADEEWITSIFARSKLEAQRLLDVNMADMSFELFYRKAAEVFNGHNLTTIQVKEITDDIARLLPNMLDNPGLLSGELAEILIAQGVKRTDFMAQLRNLEDDVLEVFVNDLKGRPELVKFFGEFGEGKVGAWGEFIKASNNFSAKNPTVLEKYMKLSTKNKQTILKFSDKPGESTIAKFFGEADDATLDALNKNEDIVEAILGHKSDYTRADYENVAEVLDDIEDVSPGAKEFMEKWLERSAGLSNFKGAARLGNELNENIVESIISGSIIKKLLQTKLDIDLDGYTLLREVPFIVPITSSTPGGFMKADIILIKYDDLTNEIDDIIIIENKLRGTTDFTPAQTLIFNKVKSDSGLATIDFVVKFNRPQYNLIANQILQVARDKIVRISDSGTSEIKNINLVDIQLVKDLDF